MSVEFYAGQTDCRAVLVFVNPNGSVYTGTISVEALTGLVIQWRRTGGTVQSVGSLATSNDPSSTHGAGKLAQQGTGVAQIDLASGIASLPGGLTGVITGKWNSGEILPCPFRIIGAPNGAPVLNANSRLPAKVEAIDAGVVATIQSGLATSAEATQIYNDLLSAEEAEEAAAMALEEFGASTFDPSEQGVQLDASEDVYHADIQLTIDAANSRDEYTVRWYRNGQRILAGISDPLLQVVLRASGEDLIEDAEMTQIGTTGAYKFDEEENRLAAGDAAEAVAKATIDGEQRVFSRLVSRDSEAE